MGCSTSHSDVGSTSLVTKLQPEDTTFLMTNSPPEETWARKSSDKPQAMGSLTAADPAKRNAGHSNVVTLSDDEDDIEAIVEELEASSIGTPQSGGGMTSIVPTVNADALGTAKSSGCVMVTDTLEPLTEDAATVQSLPRQQLEEAGKLAEARRRFDNQRYQSSKGVSVNSLTVHVADPFPAAPPGTTTPTVVHAHSSSRLVGLSLNGGAGRPEQRGGGSCRQPEVELPGGVREERAQPAAQKKRDNWWDRGSRSFDEDDEALMAEIIDEVEKP